jgi:hypothetical protein
MWLKDAAQRSSTCTLTMLLHALLASLLLMHHLCTAMRQTAVSRHSTVYGRSRSRCVAATACHLVAGGSCAQCCW